MKRFISYYLLVLLLLFGRGRALAVQYQTVFLKKTVQKLALDSMMEAMAEKNATKYFDYKEHRMVVHYDGNSIVDHLGIVLFQQELKKENPSPVYNFLERAYLDYIYKVSENKLYLNNIQFHLGSWESFKKVSQNTSCIINNGMDRFYTVKWQEAGHVFLSIAFPANYEYFANDSRRNLEQQFVELLRGYRSVEGVVKEKVDMNDLGKYKGKNLYVKKGTSYVISSINSDTYYQMLETPRVEGGDTIYRLSCNLVQTMEFPKESFSNLVMGRMKNAPLHLIFSLSNKKNIEYQVNLLDFLAYCQNQGCKTYFGYEGEENDKLMGTLVLSNKLAGYDHVVYLAASKKSLIDAENVLDGTVYLYVPSSNIKDLFSDNGQRRNNRKNIFVNIKNK